MMHAVINQFEAYLLTEKRVSANTLSAYRSDLNQLLTFFLALTDAELQPISHEQIKEYLAAIKEKKISARSMARKISTFKLFLRWAHQRLGWPAVAGKWYTPKIEKKLPLFLNQQEIESLLAATHRDSSLIGQRNKMIIYLLYATGMRISELTQLRVEHLQFDTGFVQLNGKGGKGRLVPLPHELLKQLKEYIATVRSQIVATLRGDCRYLFPVAYARKFKPISRQSVWIIIRELCKVAGIEKKVSPHIIRHSLATHLLNQGAHLRSLQLLLGHERLTTVELYTHLKTDEVRKVYDKKHPRA
jgi:integrase/recombinase XerD